MDRGKAWLTCVVLWQVLDNCGRVVHFNLTRASPWCLDLGRFVHWWMFICQRRPVLGLHGALTLGALCWLPFAVTESPSVSVIITTPTDAYHRDALKWTMPEFSDLPSFVSSPNCLFLLLFAVRFNPKEKGSRHLFRLGVPM
jgi:hypothetical protein